jgi:pimeloyl-ACP methyl ester carboxylesterase
MSARARETVRLDLPDGHLHGTLEHAGDLGPAAVLFVHGFGSTHAGEKAVALAATCARRGWPWAGFDFRGHGESSGTLRELRGSRLQEELDRVAEYLAGRGARRLFLVGSSMGGWASAWFAHRRPEVVGAVVGIAPAFDFLERSWRGLSEVRQREWRETGVARFENQWLTVELGYGLMEERGDFPLNELARGWRIPLLVFHGMRDEVVPWEEGLAIARLSDLDDVEVRLFRDGDHRLLARKEEMAEEACRFFGRYWPT